MTDRPLTDKQATFALEYLVDFNATQAAIRAGYSPRSAKQQATRLLTNASIQAALAHAQAHRREELKIDADTVVRELARIGFSKMTDVASWDDLGVYIKGSDSLDPDTEATIKEVTLTKTSVYRKNGDEEVTEKWRVVLHDKLAALDKLCRFLGIYNDSLTVDLTAVDPVKLAAEYGLEVSEVEAAIAEAERITKASREASR